MIANAINAWAKMWEPVFAERSMTDTSDGLQAPLDGLPSKQAQLVGAGRQLLHHRIERQQRAMQSLTTFSSSYASRGLVGPDPAAALELMRANANLLVEDAKEQQQLGLRWLNVYLDAVTSAWTPKQPTASAS